MHHSTLDTEISTPVPRVFIGVLSGLIQAVLSVLPTKRLSNFAFNFNLRLYAVAEFTGDADEHE